MQYIYIYTYIYIDGSISQKNNWEQKDRRRHLNASSSFSFFLGEWLHQFESPYRSQGRKGLIFQLQCLWQDVAPDACLVNDLASVRMLAEFRWTSDY